MNEKTETKGENMNEKTETKGENMNEKKKEEKGMFAKFAEGYTDVAIHKEEDSMWTTFGRQMLNFTIPAATYVGIYYLGEATGVNDGIRESFSKRRAS